MPACQFLAAFLVLLCMAAPALADPPSSFGGNSPKISTPNMAKPAAPEADPFISLQNEEYEAKVKTLPQEQQAKLAELEKAYKDDTAAIENDIVTTGFEVKHCAERDTTEIAKNRLVYQSGMAEHRNGLLSLLMPLRDKHRARRATEAAFIDQALLEKHYNYITNRAIAEASKTLEASLNSGGFDKTDCAALQAKLDAALKQAGKK